MITINDLKKIPNTPGIYRFLSGHKPIYIGKSKNIKVRLSSHIKASLLSKKEALIVKNATAVDYLLTVSDFDAIVLEARLIKEFKPKYNVSLKDDKHFLYIKITQHEEFPKVYPVRAENDKKSLYFGPFTSATITEKLLLYLRKVIPFCTQKKMGKHPCFYSKIGLCNPCPSYIVLQEEKNKKTLKKEYLANIKLLIRILKGESKTVLKMLQKKLHIQTNKRYFEQAIKTRDTIQLLNIVIFSKSFGTHETFEYDKQKTVANEFEHFMNIVFHKKINLDDFRIECYDISTLFDTHSTGSMVVFEKGTFAYNQYRKFRIKSSNLSDFDRLHEIILRRFARKEWPTPDLLLVDGGKPQVSIVGSILDDLFLPIPVIGIAKNPDRLVYQSSIRYYNLKRSGHLFKLFQQLRDESHRFVKKYHLLLRHKNLMV